MYKIFFVLFLSFNLYAFTLDTKYPKDDNILWSSHYYVPHTLGYSLILYSLLEGFDLSDNNRFHKTSSYAMSSLLLSSAVTEVIKQSTGRKRPRYTDSPDDWFYFGNKSFPSGHVASVTSMVVPYILEYHKDYPAVYLLALLPFHQMIGRIKEQAHWSSDVIAGLVIGTLVASYNYNTKAQWFVNITGNKKFIGFRYRF
jgi:hypothetical protein